jgi:hypothetical protein
MTYADTWRDAINETYTDAWDDQPIPLETGEDYDTATLRILTKAAECLRGGATHSFSGEEPDVVGTSCPPTKYTSRALSAGCWKSTAVRLSD